MLIYAAWVAQAHDKPSLVGSAFWLWVLFALLMVLVLSAVHVIFSRLRRHTLRRSGSLPGRKPLRDAWAESARRLQLPDDDAGPLP